MRKRLWVKKEEACERKKMSGRNSRDIKIKCERLSERMRGKEKLTTTYEMSLILLENKLFDVA